MNKLYKGIFSILFILSLNICLGQNAIFEKGGAGNGSQYADTLANQINSYLTDKEYKNAIDIANLWKLEIAKIYTIKSREYAYVLNSLSYIYNKTEDYNNAEICLNENLQVLNSFNGDTTAEYAKVLNELGDLYMDMRQFKNAELKYLQCYNIRKRFRTTDNSNYIQILTDLGYLFYNHVLIVSNWTSYHNHQNLHIDF